MSSSPGSSLPESVARLRPLQLVALTIGGGAVMLSAARIVIDPAVHVPDTWAVLAVLGSLLLVAWLIRVVGYSVPALPTGLPRDNAVETSVRFYAQTTVLRAALTELPFFVALALSLVGNRSWLLLLVALPGVLALFWIHAWPSARTAAAVEEGLEREGAQSYLSETLGFRATG